nr:MAG TPA: Chromatin remodeling complex ATPase [Caudoviricetes sp.]
MTAFEFGGPPRFEHQKRGLAKLIVCKGVGALLMEPGTGKTAVTLDYCSLLALASKRGEARVLVTGPLAAVDQWALQAPKWVSPQVNVWAEALGGSGIQRVEALRSRGGRRPAKLTGEGRSPKAARAAHANRSWAIAARRDGVELPRQEAQQLGPDVLGDSRPRLVIEAVNLDLLSQRRKVGSKTMADVLLAAVTDFDPDLVVIDEMHKIKSVSSNSSRLAARIGSRVPRRIGLTGTVIPHSPLDVYAQWRFLDPKAFGRVQPDGSRRVATFAHFKEDYAQMGGYTGHEVVGFKNLDRLEEIMGERSYVAIKSECLDLPDAFDTIVPVNLSPKELKAYEDMRTELQVKFREEDDNKTSGADSGGAATAMSRLTRAIRLRQITAGYLPDDEGQLRELGRSKAKTIASIVHDTLPEEKRIVIFGAFRAELEAIAEEVARPGTEVMSISGDTPPAARLAIRQRFGSDSSERLVIVAQIRTLSVAVNELVTAQNAIFASLPWQRDDIVQARDRLNRLGQRGSTTFWYAIAPNTIDEVVYQAYQDRTDLEKALMNHIYNER